MKCKPEIWEGARGPDEYGRQPWCAAESSMLMLLARRSVHFASPLLSLSALHNVVDVRAWCWNSWSHLSAISLQEWIELEMGLQRVRSLIAAAFEWSQTFCPKQASSVLRFVHWRALQLCWASIWPASSLLPLFIYSPFVAPPAPRSLPLLLTSSAHPNAADEPLMYRWSTSFSLIKSQHFLCS